MKRSVSIFTAIILLFGIIIQTTYIKTSAATVVNPKLEVLEIIDTGSSKLSLDSSKYTTTTITMKQFVASREELDGKYDLIAIPDGGEYSTKTVAQLLKENGNNLTKAHATTNILNDITNLKAKEIIDDFIEKGQPVLLGKNSIDNNGNLEQFVNYQDKKNVLIYSERYQNAAMTIANFIKSQNYKVRPRFELTTQPSELSKKYQPGEKLSFTLNIQSPADIGTKELVAKLYIDSDFNDRYETEEIVLEKQLTSKTDTITYELPRGYSGIRNWKLEVVDMGNNLKDYQKGSFYFVDQKVEVNVLQVTSSNSSSSLLNSNNMKQAYLKPDSGEYQINIDVTNMTEFNKSRSSYAKYSHQDINGRYDMLIFGFGDSYNVSAKLNTNSAGSVKDFINTNQSILFTHDTVFQSNDSDYNLWVTQFMEDTGQKPPKTNLGFGGPNKSTETNKVNEGLMTKYPFSLDENIRIATTHNQYFTLDLEEKNVTPWYNIIGSSRDKNDSYNHYYTYSKGNITYSGTGHTSTNFPDEEQRLFVNTMYRAFLGSNHAPVLTVITPKEADVIPAHQKIELSYNIQDFDLKDKNVSTKVYLNNKEVYSQENVANGSTIVQSIDHGMPEGGKAVLKIEATDKNGAKSEKTLNLTVEKVKANLEISRTASTSEIVPVGSEVKLNYSIKPKEITGQAAQNLGANPVLSEVTYKESFPANVDVIVPNNFTKTGSLEKGFMVTGNLPSIQYSKSGDKYVASPVDFAITIIPKTKNQFTLNNAQTSFKDVDQTTQTVQFNSITTRADYQIDRIQLPESLVINRGIPKKLALDLKIFPENAGIKEIKWSESTNNSVLSIDPNTGVMTANKLGAGYVKVQVTDVFGNVKEASTYVTVRIPVENIEVTDLTMNVGETKTLPIKITPEDAKYGITVAVENQSLAAIDKEKFTITALKTGTTDLVVSGINADGEVITKRAKITIKDILVNRIVVEPNYLKLNKFAQFSDFIVKIYPENATNKNLNWTSMNSSIVRVLENGKIRGESTGRSEVIISSADGNAQTTITVDVGSPLKGIATSPSEISIQKGDNSKNAKSYVVYQPGDATNIKEGMTFDTSDDYILDIDSSGKIDAKRLGKANVLITVQDESGQSFSAILKVNVIDQDSGDNDKY